jgi:hypothetical protein
MALVVLARSLGVPFGDVGGHGNRRALQLRDQAEPLAVRKPGADGKHLLDQRHRQLPDFKISIPAHSPSLPERRTPSFEFRNWP